MIAAFRPAISAVLPAYNEEANLPSTVTELASALREHAADSEIIVVDDGSADRTVEVVEELRRRLGTVRLLRHPANRGYGGALKTGFAAATREWILLLDADGQFVPAELPRLLAPAPGADLVLGYRVRRADPPHRRWYAATWRVLMRLLFGLRVRDIDCAFKLMRTPLVHSLVLESEGAFISTELLAKARRRGARFAQVPVTHRPRRFGAQTGGNVRVLSRAFVDLARLWWRVRRFPRRLPAA